MEKNKVSASSVHLKGKLTSQCAITTFSLNSSDKLPVPVGQPKREISAGLFTALGAIQRLQLPLLLLLLTSGCIPYANLVNFNEGRPFPAAPEAILNLPELKIQPDDLLSIKIRTIDMDASEIYNLDPVAGGVGGGGAAIQSTRALFGYLVDKEGKLEIPRIGTIQAAGKTTNELKEEIKTLLTPFLVDPVVTVRFFNFRVTVLGEVNSPGTYVMATERVSILDAIGQAGDFTVFSKRNNVLLIRELDGQREYIRLNLQDRELFKSPYFYLVQNDLIYVEPHEVKTSSIRDQSQRIAPWVSIVSSTLSLVITIIALTR